jgi:chromosome segregation ATPase
MFILINIVLVLGKVEMHIKQLVNSQKFYTINRRAERKDNSRPYFVHNKYVLLKDITGFFGKLSNS